MAFGFLKAPFKFVKKAVKFVAPIAVGVATGGPLGGVVAVGQKVVGAGGGSQTAPVGLPPPAFPTTVRFSLANTLRQFAANAQRDLSQAVGGFTRTAVEAAAGAARQVTVRPKVNPLFIVLGIVVALGLPLAGFAIAKGGK